MEVHHLLTDHGAMWEVRSGGRTGQHPQLWQAQWLCLYGSTSIAQPVAEPSTIQRGPQ